MKELRAMIRLELINLFGLNTYRHIRDPREKRKKRALLIALMFVGLVLMGYAGGVAYIFADFGLAKKIPMLFIPLAFIFQLMLGATKSKSLLYRERDLELLSALPVTGTKVATARIVRLYAEGIIVTALILLPSLIICGIYTGAGVLFYAAILLMILILPILPAAISAWVGILFAAIISRFRHKVLAEVLLVVVLVVGIFVVSAAMSTNTMTSGVEVTAVDSPDIGDGDKEAMKAKMKDAVTAAVEKVESLCPPLKDFGEAMGKPDLPVLLIYALISLAVMALTGLVIGRNFFRISARLRTVVRHREYQLEAMAEQSVMRTLVKKEAARYFSSGIFVANTIVGPAMAVAASVALAFFDVSRPIEGLKGLSFAVDIRGGLPLAFGGMFGMMSISASLISMEGKNWWIPRSLPLSSREILGAKALFNLMVIAPVYGLTEIILLFTVRAGLMDRLWMLLIPGVSILYSVLLGLLLNLKYPKFRWETATEVVKQSAASGFSLLGGFVLFLPAVGAMILPELYRNLLNLLMLLLIGSLCVLFYRKLIRYPLERLVG